MNVLVNTDYPLELQDYKFLFINVHFNVFPEQCLLRNSFTKPVNISLVVLAWQLKGTVFL
jgi:hypothetical protein